MPAITARRWELRRHDGADLEAWRNGRETGAKEIAFIQDARPPRGSRAELRGADSRAEVLHHLFDGLVNRIPARGFGLRLGRGVCGGGLRARGRAALRGALRRRVARAMVVMMAVAA